MNVKDLIVDTKKPEYLDKTVNQFGAAVVGGGMPGGYVKQDGYYLVRCFGDPDFIRFVIEHQGYGVVVGEQDV